MTREVWYDYMYENLEWIEDGKVIKERAMTPEGGELAIQEACKEELEIWNMTGRPSSEVI
jgi:hypothetical protein